MMKWYLWMQVIFFEINNFFVKIQYTVPTNLQF